MLINLIPALMSQVEKNLTEMKVFFKYKKQVNQMPLDTKHFLVTQHD